MFSKKPAPNLRQQGAKAVAGSTFSVFGADTAIKGDVSAKADLHVDGRIEGDVACTSLVQGDRSEIVGSIVAETARLAGTLRGSIVAGELVILKTARIHGDVHYDALTIEQGAQVDGRFAPRAASAAASFSEGDAGEPRLIVAN